MCTPIVCPINDASPFILRVELLAIVREVFTAHISPCQKLLPILLFEFKPKDFFDKSHDRGAGPSLLTPSRLRLPQLCFFCKAGHHGPRPCSFVTYELNSHVLDVACAQQTSSLLRRRVSALHHH